MTFQKIFPVVCSILILVFVAFVQERSKFIAAIAATMPLIAPLSLWIVFSGSNGDYWQTQSFVSSMLLGIVATSIFIVANWFGIRNRWPFALVILFSYGIWAVAVLGFHTIRGMVR
jgi:uncharacterized membrane protein YjdF